MAKQRVSSSTKSQRALIMSDRFVDRHVGIDAQQLSIMLSALGVDSTDQLIDQTIPDTIRDLSALGVGSAMSEKQALAKLHGYAKQNKIMRSFIGMGYANCEIPSTIVRNIFQNPNWYTAYTPYQPELAQGRLEALLNFQSMVSDLTGFEVANASLLDEATACAEAMTLSRRQSKDLNKQDYLISSTLHPQTKALLHTRAKPLGINIVEMPTTELRPSETAFGVAIQYPDTFGAISDLGAICKSFNEQKILITVATDLLALCLLETPAALGADIAVGSSQRFGVPLGFGGPHAAFFATHERFKRDIPGRIVGVSKDSLANPALRLALQTREQHIRRDKATSNICTAQVLLAVMASMYAVYHGSQGLKSKALRAHQAAKLLGIGAKNLGHTLYSDSFFDTVSIVHPKPQEVIERALFQGINLRHATSDKGELVVCALDETVSEKELQSILQSLNGGADLPFRFDQLEAKALSDTESSLTKRSSEFLTHQVFNSYHSETEFMRYAHRLERKDLSLTTSMIGLGSCTMKLNAACEMEPVSWLEFSSIHPFAPAEQTKGYQSLFSDLENWIAKVTKLDAVSLQPNSGAQGEYAGLLAIRAYHDSRGDQKRDVCLIPVSAHGTNPASAIMVGMKVVVVACDQSGM